MPVHPAEAQLRAGGQVHGVEAGVRWCVVVGVGDHVGEHDAHGGVLAGEYEHAVFEAHVMHDWWGHRSNHREAAHGCSSSSSVVGGALPSSTANGTRGCASVTGSRVAVMTSSTVASRFERLFSVMPSRASSWSWLVPW